MTDRLLELRQANMPAASSGDHDDIESGMPDPATDDLLVKFNREADAIDKVYTWAHKSIRSVNSSLSDPAELPSVATQLDAIDAKLDAVRKRLKRIAAENKDLAAGGAAAASPASLRVRVSRYTKLGNDFISIVKTMEGLRETHRNLTTDAVKRDMRRADPRVTDAQLERAVANPESDLHTILQTADPKTRHQIDDLNARNREIQTLTSSIVQLHQMFTDMSILVEGQQELINDIEYNVKQVKVDTRKAADELVEARRHQRSARKKKICIAVILIVIVLGIAAAIIIPIGRSQGWFSGSGNNSNSAPARPASSDSSTPAASTTPATTPSAQTRASKLVPVEPVQFFRSRWYV